MIAASTAWVRMTAREAWIGLAAAEVLAAGWLEERGHIGVGLFFLFYQILIDWSLK